MIRRPVGSMTRKRLPGVRRGGEALPTSKRQESRARLNPSRPLPSPILFALTALARFLSLLLLARHLHSAWRLPPPERHLHRGYDDGHLLLDRRTTTTASSTGCTSHHPHRKIIICHIHQYTVLSIPPSLPFPPLRFFSLSPRFFVPKGLVTNSPLSLSLFFSSFLPRVLRVSPFDSFYLFLSLYSPLYSHFAFSNQHGGGGLRSFVLQMPLFLALSFIAHFVCSSFYASPLPAAFLHTFAADVVSVLLISALISALGRVHAKISDLSRVLWMVY